MSKIRLSGSNSGYVEIAAAADAGNLTFTMPTTGTALFGNGNNVISGITTFNAALDINSSIDVSGTSVFNNDVTFDGATAGYDVVWDRSDNQLEFAANAKATFGNGQDMQLYHDGNHGYIADAGTGNLRLRSGTLEIQNLAGSKTSAIFSSGGGQTLNFNNNTKFVTTNTGAVITGICTATSFSGSGEGLTRTTPLSHRNRIINGDMQVSQRVGGTETTITNGTLHYILDRFTHYESTSGSATVTQVTSGYSASHTGSGKAMRIKTTGADTSLGGSAQLMFFQYIEGYNWEDLRFGTANAKPFTVSFSILASGASAGNVTGTYCVNATNAPNFNRTYVKEYTIDAVDTWKRVSLTFPGDTSGSWGTGNGAAIRIGWSFAGPNSQEGAADTWHSSYKGSTSNQKNGMANVNNFYFITDIQVEEGTVATPYERRNYADELQRCKRYFARHGWDTQLGIAKSRIIPGINEHPANYGIYVNFNFDVEMRANPTVTFGSNVNVGRPQVPVTQKINSTSTDLNSPSGIGFMKWPSSGSTGGQLGTHGDAYYYVRMGNDSNSYIDCSAEL